MTAVLTSLKPVWNNRSTSLSLKIWLMHSLVTSIFLHACESWTLTAEFQRRIQAMEIPQSTIHLMQRPCYQRRSLRQNPAGNWTSWRPPDHHKETQTEVGWTCLLFIRSCQNHLARQSERGKMTRQTEKEMGGQHLGMDRPGVHQVPEGSGEQRKMEGTGSEVISGAPQTLAIKG